MSKKETPSREDRLTHSSDIGSPGAEEEPDQPVSPLKKIANQLEEHKPKVNTDRSNIPNNNKDSVYISKEAKEDLDSKLGSLMSIKFDPPGRLGLTPFQTPNPQLGFPGESLNHNVSVLPPLNSLSHSPETTKRDTKRSDEPKVDTKRTNASGMSRIVSPIEEEIVTEKPSKPKKPFGEESSDDGAIKTPPGGGKALAIMHKVYTPGEKGKKGPKVVQSNLNKETTHGDNNQPQLPHSATKDSKPKVPPIAPSKN